MFNYTVGESRKINTNFNNLEFNSLTTTIISLGYSQEPQKTHRLVVIGERNVAMDRRSAYKT